MDLTDIGKLAEGVERIVNDLAQAFRQKRWVKIVSLAGVFLALLLNPLAVQNELKLFGFEALGTYSYRIWGVVTGSVFVIAFLLAIFAKKRQEPEKTAPVTSIIKGLYPYMNNKEDAAWFSRLQRRSILHDCLRFCGAASSRLAVLSGESGVGKSSFLQAGLVPNLDQLGQRPIYAKFADESPLDSIRQSLCLSTVDSATETAQTLVELLRQATHTDSRPIILILDQFEQFFAHNKTKTARKPFIQQMAEWYKGDDLLPVKILISIRGDFLNRLNEFQSEMKYSLTPHNNLSLERFEPQEAASVINVIAREAQIEADESFVVDLTIHELADREEGTVSPVDIQILALMLDGQKSSEERAFNRKAFQKLGGVEGLLERFLNKALQARETDARRQAAIKVLLALTDQNVRAGALTLKVLQERLVSIVSANEVSEAVSWLATADVRLVIESHARNVTFYELAHERIIPPLRRLAFKEITEAEKAQQTLNRRVNEWIGSNRSHRYLLTFKEWRLIKRNVSLIGIESPERGDKPVFLKNKEQKEEFIALSRRHFLRTVLSFALILHLALAGFAGYKWNERRSTTQLQIAKQSLINLLNRNTDVKATGYSSLLLSVLDNNKEPELKQKLRQRISHLDPLNQVRVMGSLAQAYLKISKSDEAKTALVQAAKIAEEIPASYELASVLRDLMETSLKVPQTPEVIVVQLWRANEKVDVQFRGLNWDALAEAYIELSRMDGVTAVVDNILKALSQAVTNQVSGSVTKTTKRSYSIWDVVREGPEGVRRKEDLTRSVLLEAHYSLFNVARRCAKLSKTDGALEALNKIEQAARMFPRNDQAELLALLVKGYSKLSTSEEALARLFKIQQGISGLTGPPYFEVLISLAEAFARLSMNRQAAERLEKILQGTGVLPDVQQLRLLLMVAEAYRSISKNDEATKVIALGQLAATRIVKTGSRTRGLVAVADLCVKLNRADDALTLLAQAEQAVGNIVDPSDQIDLLLSLSSSYIDLSKPDDALRVVTRGESLSGKLTPTEQGSSLLSVAAAYLKLAKTEEVIRVLALTGRSVEMLTDTEHRSYVLTSLSEAYLKISPTNETMKGLAQIEQIAKTISDPSDEVRVIESLADTYIKLSKAGEAKRMLTEAENVANRMTSEEEKSKLMVAVATQYAMLFSWRAAREIAQSTGNEVDSISALSRILVISIDSKNGSKNMESLEHEFEDVHGWIF